jgi:hypothetical protein
MRQVKLIEKLNRYLALKNRTAESLAAKGICWELVGYWIENNFNLSKMDMILNCEDETLSGLEACADSLVAELNKVEFSAKLKNLIWVHSIGNVYPANNFQQSLPPGHRLRLYHRSNNFTHHLYLPYHFHKHPITPKNSVVVPRIFRPDQKKVNIFTKNLRDLGATSLTL